MSDPEHDLEHDDGSAGELLETPHLTEADTVIRPGDLVFFHLRYRLLGTGPAFLRNGRLPELAGVVLAVQPGHELCFDVQILGRSHVWKRLVAAADIFRVFPSQNGRPCG